MSPKTYQEMMKSVKEDIYPPIQGHGQMYSPMDGSATVNECFSHGSHVTTPYPSTSGYFSSESQDEKLQLDTLSSMTPGILKPCTPGVQPSTPSTPGVQPSTPCECSDVEQASSIDGSEVFNSHMSATGCRNWYAAPFQDLLLYAMYKYCGGEEAEGDKMPICYQRLAGNESLKAIHSGDHGKRRKKKEKRKHNQNATSKVSNLTEQEVLRDGNDDNKDEEDEVSFSYSSSEGVNNHQQSEHQLTHHEPPIASHYGHWEIQKLELLLKERDKKYSELLKERDKKAQLLEEQVKKVQLLEEQVKKVQLLEEQVKKVQLLEEQVKKVQLLEEQVKNLQGRLAAAEGDVNANDDIDWLNREQNAKVSRILNNPSIKWTEALRKILVTVFGKELLAQSCSVGRSHATYKALDARKLDVVRGLIFNTYGSNKEITDSKINVIVNSSCTTARRSLKQAN